jgi:trafficking protein particle complex subunit 6
MLLCSLCALTVMACASCRMILVNPIFSCGNFQFELLFAEVLNYVERTTPPAGDSEEDLAFSKEMAAAKTERMGYNVGFRLCERLSQNRTFSASGKDQSMVAAAAQLEAVKFLCKEVWTEVFRKQIDKLQTNHRGVFVLKDLELRWLTRLPPGEELARVTAIQLLAFPCGIIRGTLSNLGIPAVVSCDFLNDGHNMASCAFNIKIK